MVEQAASAQQHLLKHKEYSKPVSLALITVAARRTRNKSEGKDGAQIEDDFTRNFADSLVENLKTENGAQPEFVAVYSFPEEFRRFSRLKKGVVNKGEVFMPAVAFAVKAIY